MRGRSRCSRHPEEKEGAGALAVGGNEPRLEPWGKDGVPLAVRRVMSFWARRAGMHNTSEKFHSLKLQLNSSQVKGSQI